MTAVNRRLIALIMWTILASAEVVLVIFVPGWRDPWLKLIGPLPLVMVGHHAGWLWGYRCRWREEQQEIIAWATLPEQRRAPGN